MESRVPKTPHQQVLRLVSAFPVPSWPPIRVQEWVATFSTVDSYILDRTVTDILKSHTKDICPPPGLFLEHARALAKVSGNGNTPPMYPDSDVAPYVPIMWFSALVAAQRARGQRTYVHPENEPYVQIAVRIGLRPEHGNDLSPGYDGEIVARAHKEFAAEWERSGDRRSGVAVAIQVAKAFLGAANAKSLARDVGRAMRDTPPVKLPSQYLAELA